MSCHVGDWDQCGALVDATVAEFGRIDVLVNNAGIAPVPPSLLDVTAELFDKTIAVNLKGPLRLTALAAEHMPAGGAVINVSSKASLHPSSFTVVYAAAKAGLERAHARRRPRSTDRAASASTRSCAARSTPTASTRRCRRRRARRRWPSGIALGRIADADEIVGTALYLASDASSYLTGELILLDGG